MFATVFSLLLAATAAAAPTTQAVQVQATLPARCVAVYQGSPEGSHLLVSADALETLAKADAAGLPLDARMARIMGMRAKTLVAQVKTATRDAQGCQSLSLTEAGDAGLALIPLIEAGRVAVWSAPRQALVPVIRTEQGACSLDAPVAGFSASIVGEPKAFLVLMTCIV
ncbi:hypothetical protein SAMN05428989_3419 [Pseudoxanthomonas sp. GM95]|uniref:hypothetical protein n=1 Tax=Pseudoxanthomonas sp. GM95 TaxID=1881043 RepID=UPI0008CFC7D8|nr:hypothetical protein [Pseudoxanthomonas sp. GM95]SEM22450.1 hypothetical protein SAMN05428989_3419 [Pseudoxanthomonas sp. GM95]